MKYPNNNSLFGGNYNNNGSSNLPPNVQDNDPIFREESEGCVNYDKEDMESDRHDAYMDDIADENYNDNDVNEGGMRC